MNKLKARDLKDILKRYRDLGYTIKKIVYLFNYETPLIPTLVNKGKITKDSPLRETLSTKGNWSNKKVSDLLKVLGVNKMTKKKSNKKTKKSKTKKKTKNKKRKSKK